jgi:hypothetical protein
MWKVSAITGVIQPQYISTVQYMCPEPEAEAMYHSNKQIPYTPPRAPPWWIPNNIFLFIFPKPISNPPHHPGQKKPSTVDPVQDKRY